MISQAERQYLRLVESIIEQGAEQHPTKGSCQTLFAKTIKLDPDEVPLLQGRKVFWEGLVGELKAFVANERTAEGFKKHGCNFWGAWSNEDGTLDVDYARLLHDFNNVDQLNRLILGLRAKPDSRKHVISLWDPSSKAKQVPCVLSYQFQVMNGRLNMIWTQRSADVMVGLASDMFSAWLFNRLIAMTVDLEPGVVTMNLGDCHIYEEHLDSVQDYVDGIWASEIMNPQVLVTGTIWDFEVVVSDYNPDNIVKFELKV